MWSIFIIILSSFSFRLLILMRNVCETSGFSDKLFRKLFHIYQPKIDFTIFVKLFEALKLFLVLILIQISRYGRKLAFTSNQHEHNIHQHKTKTADFGKAPSQNWGLMTICCLIYSNDAHVSQADELFLCRNSTSKMICW